MLGVRRSVGIVVVALAVAVAPQAGGAPATPPLPRIFPTPHEEQVGPRAVAIPATVALAASAADPAAVRVVEQVLRTVGVRAAKGAAYSVVVDERATGLPPGGYTLEIGPRQIALHGADGAGAFYAAQTLRQVARGRTLPALTIRDWPSLPHRGIVEGFYGRPWPDAARASQLDFLGANKMNLYVYSPKDDAYLRHDWRVPYPAPRLGVLGKLAQRAAANHVTFTYTLSPGLSVCYSSAADRDALVAKFQSLWNVGVSSFAVALDDIDYAKWNCAADAQAFGTGPAAAAAAQASLLDAIQNRFVETHRGAGRLVLVPTEYDGTASTPYRETLARQLDRKIAVMWTGNSVCAPSIHTDDARAARASYGHDVLVWDNFPVTCRQRPLWLELGPYEHRDPDLPTAIVGIASNPMSQPYGSRIALFTVGDYAWNTRAYDPRRSWFGSTADLAGGDPAATAALRVFADVNYASTVEPHQAPILSARIAAFWRAWRARDAHAADPLRAALDKLTTAPAVLRARLRDARFLADTAPWLDATQAWGHAALEALAALEARRSGLAAEARAHELSARSFAARAGSFSSFGEGGTAPVAVGAGVLDAFVGAALAAPG